MIIEGNITIGSSVTIASNAVPYGDAVFFANTVGLLGYDITNGPRYTYTANATYKWVVPSGVTSISVLCIGGGGAGGGGGATSSFASRITAPNMVSTDGRYWSGSGGGGGGLVYANNIPVTPGTEYIIQVGGGGQKGWQAYDPTDLDFGSVANNLGRPTAFSGGPSFFTTNAAIIARQTAMVIANGGAAGKANIDCINGTGSLSSAIYSLIGGGGGGAGGYKGAGGAGGNGGTPNQISGGSGGTTAGTKKTAGFSGGAGGGASWVEDPAAGMLGDFLPLSGKNPAANSGGGAGGSAEVVSSKGYLAMASDQFWPTANSWITGSWVNAIGITSGAVTGAYGGGGVGIYGAGPDGKISSMLYPDEEAVYAQTYDYTTLPSMLANFKNCSGSGGADNRYDQTWFDYVYSQSMNVPGSAIPILPRLMSRGAMFGGGGGSPFSHCYTGSGSSRVPIQGVGNGGPGVVRIVWPGQLRQFPNTRVQQIDRRAISAADDNFIDIELMVIGGGGAGGGGAGGYQSLQVTYARGGGGGGGGGIVMKRLRVRPGDSWSVEIGAGGGGSYYHGGTGSPTIVRLARLENPGSLEMVAIALGGGGGGFDSGANNPSPIASAGGGAGGGSPGYISYPVQGHSSTAQVYGGLRTGMGGGGAGGPNLGPNGGIGYSITGYGGGAGGGGGGGGRSDSYYYQGGRGGNYAGEGAGYVNGGYYASFASGGTVNRGEGGGGGSGALLYGVIQTGTYSGSGGSGKVVLFINDINYQYQAWSGQSDKITNAIRTEEVPIRIISLLESGTLTF